ncbi:diaminopimelate decarboxylase [Humibacter ginsenosidimutans]|uniref:Diaminopimelate decarboxylase n=1 Tax=Humibacter ginsenosidimutans TaxID=2599293 RepID=A0A5B8MAF8_9MICO|nr:diaminopimelate decarboxylase [Humibacter ginsenosidimutans]QDZ16530.1 diaminopimelate decarboxylase [Humibacter ginsenosidimutans]
MPDNPLAPDWLHAPDDGNAFVPEVWPTGIRRTDDGVAVIGGVRVDDLVADYATPLYVLDERVVRELAERVRLAFTDAFERVDTTAEVYYAGKAFLSTEVARWVTEAGLRIDVASGGELAVALAAGVDAGRLGLHGNNKSRAEIDRAIEVGVGTIVIDSEQEIARVAQAASAHGRVQRVRLRVRTGVHAHTHEFLATAHEDQKFGVALDDAERLVALIRSHDGLEFVGLHCHIGSQIFGADGFAESAARLVAVHARLLAGGPVPELNLGGGFGIAYTSADEPDRIEDLAQRVAQVLAAECERANIPLPVVAFEPGRYIVGPAGVTLYTVGTTKPVNLDADGTPAQRLYVSVDGGMSDNARPALYGADYSARIVSRTSPAEPVLVRVAGKHCESGDIVVNDEYLPADVAEGDVLAVAATGAYCWSLSSNYNYLPRPAVVAVSDGASRMIVRGETVDDLLVRDLGARHAETAPAVERRHEDAPGPLARADRQEGAK